MTRSLGRIVMRLPHIHHKALALLCATAFAGCHGSGEVDQGMELNTAETVEPALVVASAETSLPLVRVWKSPTCGCCSAWIDHVKAAGYPVEVHEVGAMNEVKETHGIATEHQSCHTALVDGYLVEGHVPADLIDRLLAERPEVRGLTVPGMPIGSPGMENGDQKEPYDVLAMLANGSVMVYDRR